MTSSSNAARKQFPTGEQTTRLELSWATSLELQVLETKIGALGRQTMNLRMMPGSQAVLIKNAKSEIVGWAGLNFVFNGKYPEFFSLFVEPDYREGNLGILLETIRADHALKNGIKEIFIRLKPETGRSITDARINSGLYKLIEPKNLEAEYLSLCTKCELFGGDCPTQRYLRLDTQAFLEYGKKIVGELPTQGLPVAFTVEKEQKSESKGAKIVWDKQ